MITLTAPTLDELITAAKDFPDDAIWLVDPNTAYGMAIVSCQTNSDANFDTALGKNTFVSVWEHPPNQAELVSPDKEVTYVKAIDLPVYTL